MDHSIVNGAGWNTLIASFPDPHLLQTWEWAQVKSRFGWNPLYMVWKHPGEAGAVIRDLTASTLGGQIPFAAALVLQRNIPIRMFSGNLRVLYVPKGPLMQDWGNSAHRDRVFQDLKELGRKQGAIFLKIDPDIRLGKGIPGEEGAQESELGKKIANSLRHQGWVFSSEQVQFRNTLLVDLKPSEEMLLAGMKQKTRYNVRLAMRKGVSVRIGTQDDLGLLYRMYAETSVRDRFVIRDESYYRFLWQTFMSGDRSPDINDGPRALPLIAEVSGNPVAALVLFYFAKKAWYIFGMSREAHREKMPNHLLQWEAMRRAKLAGCTTYDLWGAPDEFVQNDPLWGVYRFKEGLGGVVVRHLGAWDLPIRPVIYKLYTELLPRILAIMRRRGRFRTQRMVSI